MPDESDSATLRAAAEEPAAEEPAAEKPAADQAAADKPAAEQPAAEQPAADQPAAGELLADPAYEARVLRAFIKGGRLVSLPARQKKKLVVLRYVLDRVLPDEAEVEERELNARLASWHPDVAALRRYLVNAGLVDRAGMVYRRAVPVPRGMEPTGPPFV